MDLNPNEWLPSVYIALGVVIGVVLGHGIQRLSAKLGFRVAGTAIAAAVCVILAAKVWFDTRSLYLLLPFAGALVGLFRRRDEFAAVFRD